ncbi:Predicted kinase, aminoglycoside phosphotransferase (APT) family [Lentzea xinjiangensis]|uniref:Predicted kinase, aminoglycoside phosphotransferase (APT) family n=1 Tax=Lentzea xinjiangensis TaxID=402600 RepID=A0A1H9W5I3_9PSEU|nr:Predicted kinase, aminoglycoside phosphotransferase (APT) family [Lentzea xinjiangensis]
MLAAAAHAGASGNDAHLIRLGHNAIYRLDRAVIARIARVDRYAVARKEIDVAHWLASMGVPAVRPIDDIDQPIMVRGHAVTFWHELPPHDNANRVELATVLRALHTLPVPEFELPRLDPFEGLADVIENASGTADGDRDFLRSHLAELMARYTALPAGRPQCVVHGDAWPGNIARTQDGSLLVLDLEQVAVGPPEWDLLHTAISHATTGTLPERQYQEFCCTYGLDVTGWQGYPVLRDIRELRLALFAVQIAAEDPRQQHQARHRLACLRGDLGPRPWSGWTNIP